MKCIKVLKNIVRKMSYFHQYNNTTPYYTKTYHDNNDSDYYRFE